MCRRSSYALDYSYFVEHATAHFQRYESVHHVVDSAVLEAELSQNPDSDRRADAEELLTFVKQYSPG